MTRVKDYRIYAAQCRFLAQCPGNDTVRLLNIAAMWDELADEQDWLNQPYDTSLLRRAAAWLFQPLAVRC